MAIEYFDSNLTIDGKIVVYSVPNSTGTLLTYNPTTKVIGTRTTAEIVSDLSLMTTNTDQDVFGKKTFRVNFSNYTPDGLFDEVNVSHSLKLLTAGEKKIIFGYRDYGSGQYFARIGFTSNTNWSLGAINDYFTIGTNNDGTETFKLTSADGFINGNKIWNAGNFNPTLYVTQSNLTNQLLGYATLAGTQTFTGTNTFSQNIIIPNPTLGSHAVNLQSLNLNDRNFITDSRGASRPPSYYDDKYAQWDFQNVADTSAGGDYWHAVLTVSKWDSFNPEHRQEQLLFTGDELKRRTALDDGTWGSVKTIHDTGNLPLSSIVRATNNGVDANSVSETSFNHANSNMPSWFPIDNSGTLLHKQYDGNFATQFAMSYYGGIGYRTKTYGSFGAWQKIVTSSELNGYATTSWVSSNFMNNTHPANQITQSNVNILQNYTSPVQDVVHSLGVTTLDLLVEPSFFHNVTIMSTDNLYIVNLQRLSTITIRNVVSGNCTVKIDGGSNLEIKGHSTVIIYKNSDSEIIFTQILATTKTYV